MKSAREISSELSAAFRNGEHELEDQGFGGRVLGGEQKLLNL